MGSAIANTPAASSAPVDGAGLLRAAHRPDERAARRALRTQIARLERELSDAFVTAFPMGGLDQPPRRTPRRRACSTSVSSSASATSSPSGCGPPASDRRARR